MKQTVYFITVVINLLLVGCGSSTNPADNASAMPSSNTGTNTSPNTEGNTEANAPALDQVAVDNGLKVFTHPQSSGNSYSCQTCHAIDETSQLVSNNDGFKRPAHPLFNAVNREHFLSATYSEMLDATNICLTDWMQAENWQESDEDWLNLQAYLTQESNQSTPAPPIVFTQITPLADFDNADSHRGQQLFNNSCANCHGENGLGGTHAAKITARELSPTYIANKVRTSGPTTSHFFNNLSGGRMPFWSQERLSDADLNDIIAFVSQPVDPVSTGYTCDGNDHPKVGISRTLSSFAHEVSGDVSIIDNCTIEIAQFSYDGGGPLVYFYGTDNTSFVDGFRVSPQLNGQTFEQETYTIKLSSPAVLDSLNGISVWCADFDVSFGDTFFN